MYSISCSAESDKGKKCNTGCAMHTPVRIWPNVCCASVRSAYFCVYVHVKTATPRQIFLCYIPKYSCSTLITLCLSSKFYDNMATGRELVQIRWQQIFRTDVNRCTNNRFNRLGCSVDLQVHGRFDAARAAFVSTWKEWQRAERTSRARDFCPCWQSRESGSCRHRSAIWICQNSTLLYMITRRDWIPPRFDWALLNTDDGGDRSKFSRVFHTEISRAV